MFWNSQGNFPLSQQIAEEVDGQKQTFRRQAYNIGRRFQADATCYRESWEGRNYRKYDNKVVALVQLQGAQAHREHEVLGSGNTLQGMAERYWKWKYWRRC